MKLLLAAFSIAGYLYASSNDFDHQVMIENTYCKNVQSGAWPAYKPEVQCD
jgi:hypothetical protein